MTAGGHAAGRLVQAPTAWRSLAPGWRLAMVRPMDPHHAQPPHLLGDSNAILLPVCICDGKRPVEGHRQALELLACRVRSLYARCCGLTIQDGLAAEGGRLRTWRFESSQGRPPRRRGKCRQAGEQPAAVPVDSALKQQRPRSTPEAVIAARKALLASLVAAEAAAQAAAAAAAQEEGKPTDQPQAVQLPAVPAPAAQRAVTPQHEQPAKWDAWGEELDGLPTPSHY